MKVNITIGLIAVVSILLLILLGLAYSYTVYEQPASNNAQNGNMASATESIASRPQLPTSISTSTVSTSTIKRVLAMAEDAVKNITKSVVRNKMPAGVKWGVYTGWHDYSLTEFETLTGKKPDMEMVFVHWGNESDFPNYYGSRIRDKGRTMVLFWEASDYKRDAFSQPEFSYDNVLNGSLDSYFTKFAEGAKAYGGELILIPYSEFNGNWYAWGGTMGDNTPEKHIAAYRYIREFFRNAPNVKFGWAPNAYSVPNVPNNKIDLYYPGDNYVDYVGIDGFNFGGDEEMTFKELFSGTLEILKKYKKPIYLFSIASAPSPKKADWIKNMMTVELYKYPEIKGWLWFNQDKERDWRINSDPASLKAFVDILP